MCRMDLAVLISHIFAQIHRGSLFSLEYQIYSEKQISEECLNRNFLWRAERKKYNYIGLKGFRQFEGGEEIVDLALLLCSDSLLLPPAAYSPWEVPQNFFLLLCRRRFFMRRKCIVHNDLSDILALDRQVSIHARMRRATLYTSGGKPTSRFQSTPACGGRRYSSGMGIGPILFQSTPACGGRLDLFLIPVPGQAFQSTPACGGRLA